MGWNEEIYTENGAEELAKAYGFAGVKITRCGITVSGTQIAVAFIPTRHNGGKSGDVAKKLGIPKERFSNLMSNFRKLLVESGEIPDEVLKLFEGFERGRAASKVEIRSEKVHLEKFRKMFVK